MSQRAPRQSAWNRKHLVRISIVSAIALLSACGGTRLPDSAFKTTLTTSNGTPVTTANGNSDPSNTGGAGPSGNSNPGGNTGPSGSSNPGGGSNPGGNTGPGTTTPNNNGNGKGNGNSTPTKGNSGGKGKANFASDTGVTASTITVCNVVTQGGPFGPYQFTPSYYGAAAFFQALNAAGGIDGRKVNFISHPDDGSDSGNLTQVHTCIDQNKAFAFVANDIYQYAGAAYVNSKGVPDIGSQPISTAYDLYPHLYQVLGDLEPRNGKTLGAAGYGYRFDPDAIYFKSKLGIKHVGVVYYDQASSQYGANNIVGEFQAAGVKVSTYQVNLGLPNFSSAVAQMKADGVDLVADAIDLNGSQKLCQAIEQNKAFLNQMKVKLSTVADWTQSLGNDLSGTPDCLAKSWATSISANFADTSNPAVAAFNHALRTYFPGDVGHNHQFALEGYAGAQWFTDAAKSCGADLTRVCVEKYMNRPVNYTAHGLLERNTSFHVEPASYFNQLHTYCSSMAQWSRAAKTWVTKTKLNHTCYQAKSYKFKLTAPT